MAHILVTFHAQRFDFLNRMEFTIKLSVKRLILGDGCCIVGMRANAWEENITCSDRHRCRTLPAGRTRWMMSFKVEKQSPVFRTTSIVDRYTISDVPRATISDLGSRCCCRTRACSQSLSVSSGKLELISPFRVPCLSIALWILVALRCTPASAYDLSGTVNCSIGELEIDATAAVGDLTSLIWRDGRFIMYVVSFVSFARRRNRC